MTSSNLPALMHRTPINEKIALAEAIKSASGLIPEHSLNNTAKIVAYQLVAEDFGIGLMEAFRAFHIVEGKPVADYSFWVARLKGAGYRVEWSNCGPESATLTLTARDGSQHVETWNKERAVRAGLWNRKTSTGKATTWSTHTETMLKARCVTSGGRCFAGEVMFNCYTDDEVEEIQQAEARIIDHGPAPVGGVAKLQAAIAPPAAAPAAAFPPDDKLARECRDIAKSMQWGEAELFTLMDQLGIGRANLRALSGPQLTMLHESLAERAAKFQEQEPAKVPT